MKSIKTTEEDFIQFQESVRQYCELFGLGNWDVYCFCNNNLPVQVDAQTECYFQAKQANITIRKNRSSAHTVQYCALHEVLEIVMNELNCLACATYRESVVNELRHDAINRIVGAIVKCEKKIENRLHPPYTNLLDAPEVSNIDSSADNNNDSGEPADGTDLPDI